MRRAPVAPESALATSVLPTPASPSTQQRLLERGGQIDGDREAPVGEIALARQSLPDSFGVVEAHASDAVSSARRVSTRARWRL